MRVTLIGTGYVGLVSGTCLAERGATITCVDVDTKRIDALNRGEIPLYEPGLEAMVQRNVAAGRLNFSGNHAEPVSQADLVFIAVGTPTRPGDGRADLGHVYTAARSVATHLDGYTVVVNKSTVPVGTARQVRRLIREENPNADFDIAANPEFLREGSAISDFLHPDRVVIGVESARAEARLRALYRPLNLPETAILVTNPETAELVKYASNAFLATKISFINELSVLCEAVGADVEKIADGMGLDKRIGRAFLRVGPGDGGSCFPKDTLALLRTAQENQVSCRIVEATVEANAAQKARMIKKIREALGGDEAGKLIGVLGLTFKPETDDMREAPALAILPALLERGARIRAHDPAGMATARRHLPKEIRYCADIDETLTDVDAAVLLTEWRDYQDQDLEKMLEKMRGNVFVDLRNVHEPARMSAAGFAYYCVGRTIAA